MEADLDIKFELFSGNVVVCDKPCLVYAIIAESNESAGKSLTIRDGVDDKALMKLVLYGSIYAESIIIFQEPIKFKKGLYLEFQTGMDYAMVQYKSDY